MRNLSRTMIGLLLGAAMVSPIAAQAQDRGQNRGERGFSFQRGGQERDADAGRAAVAQGREAARAVERPAPAARGERPAPVARVDNPTRADRGGEGRRQWQTTDRNGVDPGAGAIEQRRAPVTRETEAGRDRSERRNWNRDGDRDRNVNRADRDRNDRDRNDRNRNDGDRNWNRDGRNDGNRSWTSDRRDWDGRNWDRRDDRSWDRNWRSDRRYSWQDYRKNNRNVYRLPRYEGRYGYSYRRWSPGYRFDPFYYGSSYWINDPFYYRLPPAYGDYRWVRYYDDAALVDIRTGEIIDIIYSFFF